MAGEQDFFITIKTTADTAGIKQTEAELRKLGVQVESIKAATTGAAGAGGLAGGLASALGVSAVGVGLTLNRAIKAYGDEQVRIQTELDQQLTTLIKSAQKWDQMARSATSMADVIKVAESATETLSSAQEKFLTFQNKGLDSWKEFVDLMVKGPTMGGSIFGKAFEEEASRLATQVERIRDARRHAVEDAKATTDAFDEEKLKPFDEAFKDINDKLQEQERLQQQVGTSNIESYIQIGKQIETYKQQLKELISLEQQRKREAEATGEEREKDVESVQKQVDRASPQVRRMLMQEQAAVRARGAGDETSAAAFERSAADFRRGATPAQLQEHDVLKALLDQNVLLGQIRDAWR